MIFRGYYTKAEAKLLAEHKGHELELIKYATDLSYECITIACIQCHKVLVDFPREVKK